MFSNNGHFFSEWNIKPHSQHHAYWRCKESRHRQSYDIDLFILEFSSISSRHVHFTWWRHQVETFSALLAICAGNSPVPGEFPTQRPVTRSFDVYFDLSPNKRLSEQLWGWWFETLSPPLWRDRNVSLWCLFASAILHRGSYVIHFECSKCADAALGELYVSLSDILFYFTGRKPGQLRCGDHCDQTTVSLLFQDDVGGLEVRLSILAMQTQT